MHDYASWDLTNEKVTSLLLDDMNPRIPTGGTLDQRALIAEMVEHDKVYNLAKDIAEVGWFTGDALIGLRDADMGKTVILEGNRRLAALKLLISPEQAPEKWSPRFRALRPDAPIERVRVLHAPSREAAAPIILQRHTGESLERWSPLMQARFYRNLTSGGLKLKDVADPSTVSRWGRSATPFVSTRCTGSHASSNWPMTSAGRSRTREAFRPPCLSA